MPPSGAPVDDKRRYDLYLTAASAGTILPAAGGESAAHVALDAGALASAVFDGINTRAQRSGRIPSLFYAPRCVQGSYDEAVDATLQTRGGGVALSIITKPFLCNDRCVTQLLRFLHMREGARNGASVKLRFALVGLSEEEFLQHPLIQPHAHRLANDMLHSAPGDTMSEIVSAIVELAWQAWLSPSSPSVLGATVKDSLLDLLRRVFREHETATAKFVFGIDDPRVTTLADVFSLAIANYMIGGGYEGSTLLDKLVTAGSGLTADEKRAAVAAFELKWVKAGAWSWGSESRVALKNITLRRNVGPPARTMQRAGGRVAVARLLNEPRRAARGLEAASTPSSKRNDLLISCCGKRKLVDLGNPAAASSEDVGDLARAVGEHVKSHARDHGRAPSVAPYDTRDNMYDVVMQLRGGGLGLFLLTREFFHDKRCVATLVACLDYAKNGGNGSSVQLRLVCLERDVEELFNDDAIEEIFPKAEYEGTLLTVEAGTVAQMAEDIAKKIVWEAWAPSEKGEPHAVLGGDITRSFRDLPRAEGGVERSHILCNDCGEKSVVRYHFAYHKCFKCESYNTKILSYSGEDAQSVAPQPVAPQSVAPQSIAPLPGSSVSPELGLDFAVMMFPTDDLSVPQSFHAVRSVGSYDYMERLTEFSSRTGLYPHASGSLPIPGESRQPCFSQSYDSNDSGPTLMQDLAESPSCPMALSNLSSMSGRLAMPAFATSPELPGDLSSPTTNYIVEAALRFGTAKLSSVRVLVMGGSGRGKTSTVASLLGHSFEQNRESTHGIDLKTHILLPGHRGLPPDEIERRARMDSYKACLSRVDQQKALDAQAKSGPQPAALVASDKSRANESSEAQSNATELPSEGPRASPFQARASEPQHPALTTAHETLSMGARKEIRHDNGKILRIWDFGGQQEYESSHQLFISQRSVLMFAINLEDFWCEATREGEFFELLRWFTCAFALTEKPEMQHVVVVGTRKSKLACDNDIKKAWQILKTMIRGWSKKVYNTWVIKKSGGEAMMKMIALENDGAINNEKDFGLLQLEKYLWSITEQVIARSMDVPVRWRALLEELVQVGDKELFLTKRRIMEEAAKFPGFEQSHHGVEATVMEMLYYFRDLGELTVFDMSSQAGDSSSKAAEKCIIFVKPEKLLCVLRAIIGPSETVAENLEADQKIALERGIVDMQVLDALWKDVPDEHRSTMLETLCSFDLLVKLEWDEQGQGKVGIPALMPQLGSDADSFVERMGRRHDERDLEVYTIFTELFPVGLIGVLIASLHNTVGRQRTAVHDFRADGALLKLNKGERVFVKYVTHGQDSMGAHIKWLFRGKAPVGIAHRCLQQFYVLMQCQFRKVDIASYRHVIISDCALDLSCCPSDVADCDGYGCGAKGSVELKIDSERLWDDGDSSELRVGGCQCSRCFLDHDHAPLKYPGVGCPIVVGSQSVISEPSPKRYDLLISCHGEQKLRDLGNSAAAALAHVRDLASAVDTHVKAFARDRSRAPSVFLIDAHSDVYDGVMQLRGGGVGLFLLTREFFRNERCVGALLSCLDYAKNGKNGSSVQLRLVCLEHDVEDIFNDAIEEIFPKAQYEGMLLTVEAGTVAEIAEYMAKKIVWEAWTVPQEGENHAVLGRDIEDSFRDLTSFFGEDYFAVAKSVLHVQSRGIESVEEVFERAKANSTRLGYHNVEALQKITLSFRAPAAQRERNESAIRAYEKKWMSARMWEWGSSERDRLEKECTMGKAGRRESLCATLRDGESSLKRRCPW